MARPLRVQLKNGWYQVTGRGANRQRIFYDEQDRRRFLELIGQMSEQHAVEVHAYVLMDNHYHLLVRTPHANLSAAMHWLAAAYSIWWNRRHDRAGPVFQGRFKAVVVEPGEWVLACSLHIHLTPVAVASLAQSKKPRRAGAGGVVRAAESSRAERLEKLRSYPWSSYRAYAGYGPAAEWLNRQEVLGRAGGAAGYRRLAEGKAGRGLDESLWPKLKWGWVLGGEGFARKVRAQMEAKPENRGRRALRGRSSWVEVVRAVKRARGEPWAQFAGRHGDPGLAMALYVARRRTGLTLGALGEAAGGMSYAAVAMAIKRLEQRLATDKALRRTIDRLLQETL